MKFNKETTSCTFQPITVSFTIETDEERTAMVRLLGWNQSIPAIGGVKEGENDWIIRKKFVDGVRTALET